MAGSQDPLVPLKGMLVVIKQALDPIEGITPQVKAELRRRLRKRALYYIRREYLEKEVREVLLGCCEVAGDNLHIADKTRLIDECFRGMRKCRQALEQAAAMEAAGGVR